MVIIVVPLGQTNYLSELGGGGSKQVFSMVKWGKDKQKIKYMISPTTCQFLGSKTIMASGFVEDVTGQCAT